MATAIHQSPYGILFLAVLGLFLSACSTPEERYEQSLQLAVELRHQGEAAAALQRLEQLAKQNPDDLRIQIEMARAYADQGDHTSAAFILVAAAKQNPTDTELLLEAYAAQLETGDSNSVSEIVLLMEQHSPELLGPDEWQIIGASRLQQNHVRSALEAYLRSVRLNNGEADSETALEIGRLFTQVGNYPQAESWLTQAINDEVTELPGRFALMEVYFNQAAWGQAEQEMNALDERFPGAVEGSQWAEARAELERWKAARAEAARIAAEQIAAIELATEPATADQNPETTSLPPADADGAIAVAGTSTAPEQVTPQTLTDATAGENPPASIKLSLLDNAEAAGVDEPSEVLTTEGAAIAIEPSDPMLDGLTVTFDGAEADSVVFESDPAATPFPVAPEKPLLERAQLAAIEGNLEESIRLYWRALGDSPEQAAIWQKLSDVYFIAGQLRNAETTLLEAIRLAPQSIALTLQHLRIQQRLQDPQSFVRSVEQATERFPRSADLALSLARAYDRVLNDTVAARRQYRRFIDLEPNHPLRDEAETALSRLF
jgi:tetratricopeptide (TPR) repeat protein